MPASDLPALYFLVWQKSFEKPWPGTLKIYEYEVENPRIELEKSAKVMVRNVLAIGLISAVYILVPWVGCDEAPPLGNLLFWQQQTLNWFSIGLPPTNQKLVTMDCQRLFLYSLFAQNIIGYSNFKTEHSKLPRQGSTKHCSTKQFWKQQQQLVLNRPPSNQPKISYLWLSACIYVLFVYTNNVWYSRKLKFSYLKMISKPYNRLFKPT